MRLARLAAAGLAIGVIAGFAVALLRPRPQARPSGLPARGAPIADSELSKRSEPDESSVLDIRTGRRVTG